MLDDLPKKGRRSATEQEREAKSARRDCAEEVFRDGVNDQQSGAPWPRRFKLAVGPLIFALKTHDQTLRPASGL